MIRIFTGKKTITEAPLSSSAKSLTSSLGTSVIYDSIAGVYNKSNRNSKNIFSELGTEYMQAAIPENKDIRLSLQIGSETEDTVKRLQDENAALKEKNDAFFEMIQDLQKTIREERLDKEHTRGLLPTKTELKRIAAKYNRVLQQCKYII